METRIGLSEKGTRRMDMNCHNETYPSRTLASPKPPPPPKVFWSAEEILQRYEPPKVFWPAEEILQRYEKHAWVRTMLLY